MAEGLDQAADAFRNEIAPGSNQPRDDSGRFVQGAKPEPLFAERRVEGDPLTGDTRDAGEDARLRAIERRVADGRSEEGDDEQLRVLSDAARARDADGHDRHKPANAQPPGGDDKPEQHDQDAQGQDGKPEAEGDEGNAEPESEQDAQAARWALTLDGKPVDKVEIDVGGETREVSLNEVMRGYVEAEALTQRERDFGERAQQWEAASAKIAQEIGETRNEYMKRLEFAARCIQDLIPKELNWDAEYASDPRGAREKEKMFGHVRGRMSEIAQAMQREEGERQQALAQQREAAARQQEAYIEWGKREFQRRANISDGASLANEYTAMRKVAIEHYGFSDHEVGTVFDPRMLEVLYDASRWRRATANRPRPVAHDKGRTLAPGAADQRTGRSARRGIDDALRNQARSGSIDDTAAVFQRLLR